jgi:Arc/MetJ-type ribon-helix-helix transcriptional regulator
MKVSISLPASDIEFLDSQTRAGVYESRSAAVQAAIRTVRDREHVDSYAAAWDEWDATDDAALWESTTRDGLR